MLFAVLSDEVILGIFGIVLALITLVSTMFTGVMAYLVARMNSKADINAKKAQEAVAATNEKLDANTSETKRGVAMTQAVAVQSVQTKNAMIDVAAAQAETTTAITDMKVGGADEHLQEQAKSYKEIALEAVSNLRASRDAKFAKEGKPVPPYLAPVVPEHNSPTTKKQRETAELQTVRAELTALTLDLGLPPREAAPDEEES